MSRRLFSDAPGAANVYVMRLDEAVAEIDLTIARVRDVDDCRSRLNVRPGAFLPSFLSQLVNHHAGLPVVD